MNLISQFQDLQLLPQIQQSLTELGFASPTPVQAQAIPLILARHDLLAIAQTGTGKTAAFCLPMLQLLQERGTAKTVKCPRALVLVPTRELALQTFENVQMLGQYLPMKYAVVFGGIGQIAQINALQPGVDVLVATPGRVLDLILQKFCRLDKVEIFVLDEADRMLDMGFSNELQKLLTLLPGNKQSLLFSATMPGPIHKLAQKILKSPQKLQITRPATTLASLQQSVVFLEKRDKQKTLRQILTSQKIQKVLIFVQMKFQADQIAKELTESGIPALALHGSKPQAERIQILAKLIQGESQILVATDVAARGLDIDDISHIINFELPKIPENYVHRIGRTARNKKEGIAISLVAPEENDRLAQIEKLIRKKIPVIKF